MHLAAREGRSGPVQREIFQPHVFEELEPATDLLQRLGGDLLAHGVQLETVEKPLGVENGQGADLGQTALGAIVELRISGRQRDRSGLWIQPRAAAMAAIDDAHVLFQLTALRPAVGSAILCEQLGNDALELAAPLVSRRSAPPGESDVLLSGAPEQGILEFGVEFLPRGFQHGAMWQALVPLQRFGHAAIDVPSPAAHLAPRADQFDAALLKRPARTGDQPLGIERVDLPQAAAFGTHSSRAVETEQLRLRRLETQLAVRTGVVGGKRQGDSRRFAFSRSPCLLVSLSSCLFFHRHHKTPAAEPQRQLDRLGQPAAGLRVDRQPVDHHFDVVAHLEVEPQVFAQTNHSTVNPRSDEPLFLQVVEEVFEPPLLAADQGGQDHQPRTRRLGKDALDDPLAALCGDGAAALRAVAGSNPRVEHP